MRQKLKLPGHDNDISGANYYNVRQRLARAIHAAHKTDFHGIRFRIGQHNSEQCYAPSIVPACRQSQFGRQRPFPLPP